MLSVKIRDYDYGQSGAIVAIDLRTAAQPMPKLVFLLVIKTTNELGLSVTVAIKCKVWSFVLP